MARCPVCLVTADVAVFDSRDHRCRCQSCGDYRFTDTAGRLLDSLGLRLDRKWLSATVRVRTDLCGSDKVFVTEREVFGLLAMVESLGGNQMAGQSCDGARTLAAPAMPALL